MKTIAVLLTLAVSLGAFAGKDGGNGGGGILCIGNNGKRTVRLLDLQEAERELKLTIVRSNRPWKLQLEEAMQEYQRVNADYAALVRKELTYLESNTLPSPRRLPPPSDTSLWELAEPRNCFLEGVANYDDVQGKLYIDTELDELMSETDRAALRFHEAWYKVQRKLSPTVNSKSARRVTGYVFAKEPMQPSSPLFGIEQAISQCTSEDNAYRFYVLRRQAENAYEILFERIKGINVGERTAFVINSNTDDPLKYNVDEDIMSSITEGFVTFTRELTKVEHDRLSGADVLAQKGVYALMETKYGPTLRVLFTSSDWSKANNLDMVHMDRWSRYGFDNDGPKWFWRGRPGLAFENFSNYVALHVGGEKINFDYYSKAYNSRFNCASVK